MDEEISFDKNNLEDQLIGCKIVKIYGRDRNCIDLDNGITLCVGQSNKFGDESMVDYISAIDINDNVITSISWEDNYCEEDNATEFTIGILSNNKKIAQIEGIEKTNNEYYTAYIPLFVYKTEK